MFTDDELQKKFISVLPYLDESAARLYLGSEAQILGRGGKQCVAKLAGVSRVRIDKRIAELSVDKGLDKNTLSPRIRKIGGGRKTHKQNQSGLMETLASIVNPRTRGDPVKVLLWSSKSL